MCKMLLDPKARLERTKRSALKRGIKCTLSVRQMKKILTKKVCAYSGEEFENIEGENLTLERIDPNVGYTTGNVIPVKKKYNIIRGNTVTSADVAALLIAELAFEGQFTYKHAMCITEQKRIVKEQNHVKAELARLTKEQTRLENKHIEMEVSRKKADKDLERCKTNQQELTVVEKSVIMFEKETFTQKLKRIFI